MQIAVAYQTDTATAFDISFSGCQMYDKVHANALCVMMRDDMRVQLAAHVSDHASLRIRLVLSKDSNPAIETVASIFRDAAARIVDCLCEMQCAWERGVTRA